MAEKVVLGDFVFELGPRRQIDINSPRSIAKIDIPGKAPDYQDMGEDEHTIGWGGVLSGSDAYEDMLSIEAIKQSGKAVKFIKGRLTKTVRIKDLSFNIVRDEHIEYSINLVVIQQENLEVTAEPDPVTKAEIQQEESSAASEPKPEPSPPPQKTYRVVSGDTLWGIAQKNLGNGNRWNEVASINGIGNPRALQVGVVLKLPAG